MSAGAARIRRAGMDRGLWRVQAARTLAWALLLGGWIGVASLAQARTAAVEQGFALLALWLFALGGWTSLFGRWRIEAGLRRGFIGAAATICALALWPRPGTAGLASLIAGLLAFAAVVALASVTVRACRDAASRRPGPPFAAAATGAVLAWALVGDIADPLALAQRLAIGVAVIGFLLALLQPVRRAAGTRGACRAALFDCSMPGGASGAWREPGRWPVMLASWVMLPMMCSLSLMTSLCRGGPVSAQAMLALHLAAMFAPAWLMSAAPAGVRERGAAWASGPLLGLGALAVGWMDTSGAWIVLALAHGAAWSLAWSSQFGARREGAACDVAPWRAAAVNATAALGLGLAVGAAGLQVLGTLHLALGAAGLMAFVVALAAPLVRTGRWKAMAAARQ